MTDIRRPPGSRRSELGAVAFGIALLMVLAAGGSRASSGGRAGLGAGPGVPGGSTPGRLAYRGVLTFATTGPGDPFGPSVVQDLDLGSGRLSLRFDGLGASSAKGGETVFITRLASGYIADHGIVVADSRGVPGAPLYVCKDFHYATGVSCSTPRLSPDGRLVAFGIRGEGKLCKNNFGLFWADHVVVSDRKGREAARFEGYHAVEWLPDGRLLLMGSMCRDAGIWVANASLGEPSRIDAGQVATPAGSPAVSPDGRRLAFVWNKQLWQLTLSARPELTQVTRLPHSVVSAAWSPDGTALALLQYDVTMPLKSVVLLRPGDETSMVVHSLPVYPYGPITWR